MTLLQDALLSYVHILSNILMGAALYTQLKRFKPEFDLKDALAIQRADILFGVTALVTLATGLVRSLAGPKGKAFYFSNPIFHTKLSLFIVIGLLSIYPTVEFLRWRKDTLANRVPKIAPQKFRLIRRIVFAEFHLFILLPLLATLIARGFGLKQ